MIAHVFIGGIEMIEEKKKKEEVCEESCQQTVMHEDTILTVKEKMLNIEVLTRVADLFKVLGDKTRTRILHALSQSEMCVCDLAYLLDMTQSSISHQLRVLKQAHLVKNRKEGKVVYYSLADSHVTEIFNQALEHILED